MFFDQQNTRHYVMHSVIFWFLSATTAISNVQALSCYQCASSSVIPDYGTPACTWTGINLDDPGVTKTDCPPNINKCIKVRSTNLTVVARSCGYVEFDDDSGAGTFRRSDDGLGCGGIYPDGSSQRVAYDSQGSMPPVVENCICETDYCNSADVQRITATVIFLAIFFLIM